MHAANDHFRYLFLYGLKVQMLQSCAVGPCPPGVDESARILRRCISALERLEATTLSNPSLHGSVRLIMLPWNNDPRILLGGRQYFNSQNCSPSNTGLKSPST